MKPIALIFAILSMILIAFLVSGDKLPGSKIYLIVYLVLTFFVFLVFFFHLSKVVHKSTVDEYKKEITALREDADRTLRKLSADLTGYDLPDDLKHKVGDTLKTAEFKGLFKKFEDEKEDA